MRLNRPTHRPPTYTYEGGAADPFQKPEVELERTVATCLLWEPTFYESGDEIAKRIASLVERVSPATTADLARKAKNEWKLRHVPLYLARLVAKHAGGFRVGDLIYDVIQRPDELAEFLSIYWSDDKPGEKKSPLSAQVKKGLARAFGKFSDYQFQKWDREGKIRLRDVMFLTHPKPFANKIEVFKQLAENTLPPADTWEVALSSGQDKKATWERLLQEKKLGYMALLMNLRNMTQVGVNPELIERAIIAGAQNSKALPFRFVSAYKYAPAFAQALSLGLKEAAPKEVQLPGSTVLVIDVSGSMDAPISQRSTLNRWEAASALAILCTFVCERFRVFTFSDHAAEVPAIQGLGMLSAITNSQPHYSTYLSHSLQQIQTGGAFKSADRTIVITDEQTHDGLMPCPTKFGYIINVAPYKPSLQASQQGYKRINGWSERLIDWMIAEEMIDIREGK